MPSPPCNHYWIQVIDRRFGNDPVIEYCRMCYDTRSPERTSKPFVLFHEAPSEVRKLFDKQGHLLEPLTSS